MTYIEQKSKEFKELKIIDGQEADGIIDEDTRISDWIKQALTEAYNKGQTDYHNHIVEKFKEKYKFSSSTTLFEILSILQDTNPKE